MSEQPDNEPEQGDEPVEPTTVELTPPEYEVFEKSNKTPPQNSPIEESLERKSDHGGD